MHVLYFHQHFSTPEGKTGTRSYEMARRLVGRGHTVTLVTGTAAMSNTGLRGPVEKGIRRGNVDGIDVIEIFLPYSNYDSLFKRTFSFLRFAARSIALAWREPYDLLFATSTPLTAGIPGIAMRLFKPRHPFVFEVRDLWPELPRAMGVIRNPVVLAAMSLLEKVTYTAMHAGVALSPGIRLGMQRRSSAGKELATIPNGCDLERFRPRPRPLASSGRLRAVFTGAHGQANGLHAVLDAAAELKRRGREGIELTFIGDGKLKPALQRRSQEEGLNNCCFHEPVSKTSLADQLGDFDVGLMILANVPAFYYGTSPNKFFDYLATGLPVLTNYPGWLAELIAEHQCGIAVPPDDPVAFANALERLADDEACRLRMGRNARRLAESDFARDKLADAFAAFLEGVEERSRRMKVEG